MTLLVRDEADIVDAQIAYHLAAGVDVVIATDHRSVDGTTEILERYEAQGKLHLIREDGEFIRQSEWVTRMARIAATEYEADWVVHSDADEFWWPRRGTLRETLERVPRHVGVVRGYVQSFVPRPGTSYFAERMIARLATVAAINDVATSYRASAQVAHRAGPDVVVGQGNHSVDGLSLEELRSWLPLEILHFPFRTPSQLLRKHANTISAWERNLRGDLTRARRFLEQSDGRSFWSLAVVDDALLDRGLESGFLVIDTRLRDALRALERGTAPMPGAFFDAARSPTTEVAAASDASAIANADAVRVQRWLDFVGLRVLELERRSRGESVAGRGVVSRSAARTARGATAVLRPRERLLPGLGSRLDRHPDLVVSTFRALRRAPGRRMRAAVYKSVSRPLAARMTSEIVTTVHGGLCMSVDMGDVVGKVLATSGVWEPYVVAAIEHELAPGDVYVDVGAHVGFHALIASLIVGEQGHVYALEPTATTFQQLCANLELNGVSNVTALRVAAGESEGRGVMLDAEVDNTGTASIRPLLPDESDWGGADSVSVRPVAALLDPAHVSRVRLVKIDVEGFEAEVLRGLEPVFEAGARPSLIVELHQQAALDATDVLARMSTSYDLTAYELVRDPRGDRFVPPPPPREIALGAEMQALASERPVNVLVTPSRRHE